MYLATFLYSLALTLLTLCVFIPMASIAWSTSPVWPLSWVITSHIVTLTIGALSIKLVLFMGKNINLDTL